MANAFASETFAGSRLVRAVCRRTLCRAHVAHDSLDAKEQFLSRLPFTDPFRGEAMIEHPDGDPNAETIVYLARAGA